MPDILFAAESDESRSLPLTAQRLVNFFTEKQRPGAKSQTPLFGAPGQSAFADTSTITGAIAAFGTITPGSDYGAGIYYNVPLTGGSGSGALATITVSGGAVIAVFITAAGISYAVNDVLSALSVNVGGSGSGFFVSVASVTGQGIATTGINSGGYFTVSSYTKSAPLTGGSGSGATANVGIGYIDGSGYMLSYAFLVNPGTGYKVGDLLSGGPFPGENVAIQLVVESLALFGQISSLGAITGGTGYSDSTGYFPDVPLTGGSGTGATGNITLDSSGGVSAISPTNPGINYLVGDSLSAALGGAVATLGSITPGSGYAAASYANVPLTGGTGNGAVATIVVSNVIATLGSITAGSGYVAGSYTNVPLTGGSGTGATANIVVNADGTIHAGGVTIVNKGINYAVSDSLSASNTHLGGSGSGFAVLVATVTGEVSAVTVIATGLDYTVSDVLSASNANLGGAGSGFSVPVTAVGGGSGFSVLVGAINMIGPTRGSWVKQDVPFIVAGDSLYQLGQMPTGIFNNVPLTGGSGSGATANITITLGVVTVVSLMAAGVNYQVGDILSAPLGAGAGFSVPVATLSGSGIATLGTIAGGSNYVLGTCTLVGSGIGGTDIVGMSDNGFQLCIVSAAAGAGWIYDTNPQSATFGFQRITDPNFYPAATVSFFDGYFIFDRIGTNEFFLSNLYDGTTFNGLDFASAESQPDFVTGTIQNLQLLFVICQEHLELWYDAGAFPFPFQRYTGAGISYGCVASQTIIKQDGAIFFLGSDKIFYRLQSTVPIRVSTHSMEHIIAQDTNLSAAYCFTFTLEGHKFVVLQLPASKRTLIFDISTNRWAERESWDQNNASLGSWRPSTAFRAFNSTYLGDGINEKVNLLDWTTYTELGNTIRGLAYSIPYHQDRKRLFVSRFELDIQAGVGTSSGAGSDPQIMLSWSIDGAQTFKPLQFWRSMGKIGEYLKRLRWLRMGNGRQFVFQIVVTDPVPRVIIGAHADISIGM